MAWREYNNGNIISLLKVSSLYTEFGGFFGRLFNQCQANVQHTHPHTLAKKDRTTDDTIVQIVDQFNRTESNRTRKQLKKNLRQPTHEEPSPAYT